MRAASNDAELARLLKPEFMRGLEVLGKDVVETGIEETISAEMTGGSTYSPNGAGSVSQAWSTEVTGDGELGKMDTHYDSSKLYYGDGHHEGAYSGEQITDMMSLLDENRVGTLFGVDNPAMEHEGLWDRVIENWEYYMRRKIVSALRSVGIKIW